MTINITTRVLQAGNSLRNTLTKRMFSSVALGVMGALVISVAAFTGTASASISDCPDPGAGNRRVCMWNDLNYAGSYFWNTNPVAYVCYSMPGGYNDTVSSLYNRTGYYLFYYEHGGCSNQLGSAMPYAAVGYVGAGANDKISSYKLIP